ncbi:hypothetical protein Gogos_015031 [Gossypium gossypioides]|uniref:DUF4283 domain-containing protein n=1 Tax=Gossypium gossypioides TaxID=34282 RepID=A0A7J9C0D8_GOSGO|nr:hypothetical protein [Gossypium gossypioides]
MAIESGQNLPDLVGARLIGEKVEKKDKFGAHVNKFVSPHDFVECKSRIRSNMKESYNCEKDRKMENVMIVRGDVNEVFLHMLERCLKMEAQGRTWLNGWFVEIKPRSSLTLKKHRIARLAVYGLPLHVWNYNTFRRIAAILALGEETLKLDGFSHGTMSIMTDHLSRIEATITVQCGVENFQVRISENRVG